MDFQHPDSDYIEKSASFFSWLWVLLFGPLYWVIRGVWRHAVAHLILAILTAGIVHFLYPFFTYSILRKHYLRQGSRPLD